MNSINRWECQKGTTPIVISAPQNPQIYLLFLINVYIPAGKDVTPSTLLFPEQTSSQPQRDPNVRADYYYLRMIEDYQSTASRTQQR